MSALRREDTLSGRIDWVRFLIRRVRRLLPLLLVTIVFSLFAGYWLLSPFDDFQELCKSAMAAAGLSANFYLWRHAGSYFSPGVDQMPLMHLWSLSVEEQFYLLTPIVFLLARCRAPGGLIGVISALTATSLGLTIWGALEHPTASFYLPITRAWEFGLGALAALLTWRSDPPRWTGIALLAALAGSLFWLDEHSSWLPLYSGLPAFFTALWLTRSSGPRCNAEGTGWLRTRWLCWIGRRSYAWYLLHWPFIVFYRKYYLEDVGAFDLLVASVAALVAADFAHRWIEQPARFSEWALFRPGWRLLSLAAASTAFVVAFAFAMGIHAFERQTDRRWQSARTFDRWVAEASECMSPQGQSASMATACTSLGNDFQTQPLILWGDSHAYPLRGALLKVAQQQPLTVSTWSMGGCAPLIKDKNLSASSDKPCLSCTRFETPVCTQFEANVYADILLKQRSQNLIVVLAARWEVYMGMEPLSVIDKPFFARTFAGSDPVSERRNFELSFRKTVENLVTRQIELIIVAPVPEQRVPVQDCFERFENSTRCLTKRSDVERYRESTMQLMRSITQDYPSVQVIDPMDIFCNELHCTGAAGSLWYVDDDHLSTSGTNLLLPALDKAITEARNRIETTHKNQRELISR